MGEVSLQVTERVQPTKKEAHYTIRGCCTVFPVQQPLFLYKIDQLSCEGSAFGVTLARDNAVLPACACFTRLLHAVSVPP